MYTRFITTGLCTSLTLLVVACSSNPVTSENELSAINTDVIFASGESINSGEEAKPVIDELNVDGSSSFGETTEHMIAARQSASVTQSQRNEYLTQSVSSTYLQRPLAPHDYSQFTLPAVGQSGTTVLQNYGQPARRQPGSNGVDMWDYGSFRVVFRNNAVSNASMWRMQHLEG